MEEASRVCGYCGGAIPLTRRSNYCCKSCTWAARMGRTPSGIRGQSKRTCIWCNIAFEKNTGKQKFCCRDCSVASAAQKRKGGPRKCAVCSASFEVRSNSKTCSPECHKKFTVVRDLEAKQARFGPPRTCRQCAKVFTWNAEFWIDYCSKACRNEARAEAKKRDGHNRRARQAGARIEHFGPTYILKRDNYICQACGVKTKPKEKPTHPLYPNVDHIVPLSMGGEHSKKNCRCVCAACNSKKSNGTLNDQLLLFG